MRIWLNKTMRRIKVVPLVLFVLGSPPCILGGGVQQKIEALNRTSPDTFIVLQRGACERRCSAYRVIIFDDGTLIWDGQAYVKKLGLAMSTVDTFALKQLIEEIQAMDYFHFANEYVAPDPACGPTITDEPVVMVSVSARGQSKTIIHSHSCQGPIPGKLTALEEKIDKLAHSTRWR